MRSILSVMLFFCVHSVAWAAIDVNKSFSPPTIYPGQVSRLTIKLFNSSLLPSTNTTFTDTFPDNIFITDTPNLVSNCGGTVTHGNTSSAGHLTLTDGVIPASDGTNPGTCEVTVEVTSRVKGTYINEILAGDVTSITDGTSVMNTQVSQGTLAVILQNLTGSMSLDIGDSLQGHETSMRRITLNNPNPVALTGVAFDYDMYNHGYNIRAVEGGNFTTTCGGGVDIVEKPPRSSYLGPTSLLTFSNGTIPANSSCEIAFEVEPSRSPTRPYRSINLVHKLPVNAVTTQEGATNSTPITGRVYTLTGILVRKYFNNAKQALININDTDTATLRIAITNYNAKDIANLSINDIMPTLSPANGEMVVESIDKNTCGGTVSNNTTSLSLNAGMVKGAEPNKSGSQSGSCEIVATVSVNAPGSYVNDIPEGVIAGYEYDLRHSTATLTVLDRLLDVTKSFDRTVIYQGDTTNLKFALTNYSSLSVSNISITDDLNTVCSSNGCLDSGSGFRVGSAGIISNTCGGNSVVMPNDTVVRLQGLSLAPQQQCQVLVQIKTAADAYPIGWKTNTVPIGNITFDTPNITGKIYPATPSAKLYLSTAFRVSKSWDPEIIGPLGLSRLRINIRHYSNDRNSASAIKLTDVLPDGHVVAAVPNVLNGCGGTLAATPGADTISLTDASLPSAQSSSSDCSIYVDVKAPAMTPPNTTEVSYNRIPGDAHGAENPNFSATDDSQPAPYNRHENYSNAAAKLTRIATGVTVNKEFLPVNINGGGVSRVRIEFSNIAGNAIDLTDVGITDDFSDTNMRLHSSVDAAFTDTEGNPNANGCEGGLFVGTPGGTSITLSGAKISANSICRFEFNVTAFQGGNHINRLSIGDMKSAEGVTNQSDVAATLTVGRQVNVGKGFVPSVIAEGETSTLTIDFYNTNKVGNSETGASPALIDTLPAGMHIIGTPTTTCSGGNVSTGTDGGNAFIRLDGGTFVAGEVCKITAQVTTDTTGIFTNNIAVDDLNTLSGARNPDRAEANLRVITKPTIRKSFSPNSIPKGGTSTLIFTISNPNSASLLPTGLTGVRFTDALSNMAIAKPMKISSQNCGDMKHNSVIGGTSFNARNISIPPSSTCTIRVAVTSDTLGSHNNQTSGVETIQTVSPSEPSNVAVLKVLQPATLSKSFDQPTMTVDGTARLTLTISNPNDVPIRPSSVALYDYFPSMPSQMKLAGTPNITTSCGIQVRGSGNTGTAAAGDVGVLLRYGFIPANGSCSVSMDVAVSSVGQYVNTTGILSTSAGISPAASATINAVATDYSDAPTTGTHYGTTLHKVVSGIYLGAGVTMETAGYDSSNADGDADDGVTLPASFTQSKTLPVTVRVAGAGGYLQGWVDWNGDGDFDDADEQVATDLQDGSSPDTNAAVGVLTFDVTPPVSAATGVTFARFRWSTTNNLDATTAANDGEVEDYALTIKPLGQRVSGRVFNDSNVNQVSDASDKGISQLPVVLYDVANKRCVSTRTNAAGYYAFNVVPPGDYQLYEASHESVPTPKNCGPAHAKDPDGYRSTTSNVLPLFTVSDKAVTEKNFGDVKPPVFGPDHHGQVLPGNVLFYAHRFKTPTKGSVSFTRVSGNNLSAGWSSLIYQDSNCNGRLDGADGHTAMTGIRYGTSTWVSDAVSVAAGGRVCLINKVFAPSNVAAGDRFLQTIRADFDYNNAIAGTQALVVKDLTTAKQVQTPSLPATPAVSAEPAVPAQPEQEATPNTPYIPGTDAVPEQEAVAETPVSPEVGPSRLVLKKTVQNMTQAGASETETINQAVPGNTLRYKIYYRNAGTGPLTELEINDAVPPYTSLKPLSMQCDDVPAEMTCTPVVKGDELNWHFTGTLPGGKSGWVSYQVVVDD